MAEKDGTVTAPAYLQVEPTFKSWVGASQRDEESSIAGARVVNVTQTRPTKPKPGAIILKVNLQISVAAFVSLKPEATVVIPESLTTPVPVVVEAADSDG